MSRRFESVIYVLDEPQLCGGVKVVFQHAQMLLEKNYQVTILGKGPAPGWIEYDFPYVDYTDQAIDLLNADLVIATYWSTVAIAEEMKLGPIIHFCQGYEANYPHLILDKQLIESAYSKSHPCLVISPHLKSMLKSRHGKSCELVSPPVDTKFSKTQKSKCGRKASVILHGIYECTWKGVPAGLEVIKKLKSSGIDIELIRISLLPITNKEFDQLTADTYLIAEPPLRVAELMGNSDLFLFPSHAEEGFGLPLLEAMASGVPFVATDIPSVRHIIGEKTDIKLVPVDNEIELYLEAQKLITDPKSWASRQSQGLEIAKSYHKDKVSRQLVSSLQNLYELFQFNSLSSTN